MTFEPTPTRIFTACVAAAAVFVASCGGSGDALGPTNTPQQLAAVTGVTITGRPLLAVGDTATLLAIALGNGGTPLNARAIAWSSSATQVATVDAAGLLHGLAAGTALVTATIAGHTAQVTVTVAALGTDVTPPQLSTLVYAPALLDLGSTHDIVISGRVTDIGSGARVFDIEFRGPTAASIECRSQTPSAGTTFDGTWSCTITVPNGVTRGDWTVEAVELRDADGNVRDVERDELAARGFPTVITIQ